MDRTLRPVHIIGGAPAVSVLAFTAGRDSARRGGPETAPSFIFSLVALVGAGGDVRMMTSCGLHGRRRRVRHLWRRCFAMWVAAASFFWGPPNRVPEIIRIPALQAAAVLVPIMAMLYWLWRIRTSSLRTMVRVAAQEGMSMTGSPERSQARAATIAGVLYLLPSAVPTPQIVSFAPMGIYQVGVGAWLWIRGANLTAGALE